jgi:uncharacterized membrane protein YfhO
VFALLGGLSVFAISLVKGPAWEFDDRVVVSMLVAILLCVLLSAWRTGNLATRPAGVLLILLLLFELGTDAGFKLVPRSDASKSVYRERVVNNRDLAQWLHSQAGTFRVETKDDQLAANWGIYHDLDLMRTYSGVTSNVTEINDNLWNSRMLLNTRYTVAKDLADPSEKDVFTGKSGLKIYENPDAFPRAWAVREVAQMNSDQGHWMIANRLAELRWKAFTKQIPPTLPGCTNEPGSVEVKEHKTLSVVLQASMNCDGMVILSDAYYPGWYATVDGKPAQIYEVDFSMRGVVVAKGKHDVTYLYRPRSVYLGALLTFGGLLLTALIWRWERRRLS